MKDRKKPQYWFHFHYQKNVNLRLVNYDKKKAADGE